MWSWSSLVGGVVSSLLAIAVIETYRLLRRRLSQRPLRAVLGDAKLFGLVSPAYPDSGRSPDEGLLTTDNAYALADVIESCRLIGAGTLRAPASAIPRDFPDNQILLGGHIANPLTGNYMSRYCPGFVPRRLRTDGPPDAAGAGYYECAEYTFEETSEIAWSFLIRLREDVTGQKRTILLLFGWSSFGTTEAAHLLRARPSLLRAAGHGSFVLAAQTPRVQGYNSLPNAELLDITSSAFRDAIGRGT